MVCVGLNMCHCTSFMARSEFNPSLKKFIVSQCIQIFLIFCQNLKIKVANIEFNLFQANVLLTEKIVNWVGLKEKTKLVES